MKKRRILLGLAVATALIGATTACGSSKDKSTKASSTVSSSQAGSQDQTSENTEKAEAALNGLSVASTVSANFTLKTSGNGGVTIVWTSNNTDVIAVSGGNATVTRSFTEDQTVTLTATAVIGGEVYATKTFNVTVSKIEDKTMQISAIKEMEKETVCYATGVVSGFLYKSGTTDPEYKTGFYLTDSTGTIYVYGNLATSLNTGDKIYISGKVSEYSGAKQIETPELLATLATNVDPDFTAVTVLEDDNALNEVLKNSANVGKTFEALVLVYANSYGAYSIEPLDYATYSNSMGEYFSGSTSSSLTNYAAALRGYEGRALRVVFYVNSTNSSGKLRGNVLAVKELTEADQERAIKYEMESAIEIPSLITEDVEFDLPTAFDRFNGYEIEWEVTGTGATIENNKLVVTAGTSIEKFTVKASTSFTTYEDVYTAAEGLTGFVEGTKYYTLADNVYTLVAADATFDSTTTYYTLEENKEVTKTVEVTDTASVIKLDAVTFMDLATFVAKVDANEIVKNDAVFIKGVVSKIDESGNIFVTDGTNEFELYKGVSDDSVIAADDIKLGQTISFVGTYSPYNGIHETAQKTANVVKTENSLDADLVKAAASILDDIEEAYVKAETDVELTTKSTLNTNAVVTWEVVTENAPITITDGKMSVTLGESTATVTIKATVTLGEATATKTFTTKVYDSTTAILAPNVAAQTKANESTDLATDLNLDPTIFTVVYDKNGASNDCVIYPTDIRLYATKNSTKGNKLTISTTGYIIENITITFTSNSYGSCAKILDKSGNAINANADGSYTINDTQFTIFDDNSSVSSNTQVRIASMLIEYSALVLA